MKRVLITFCLLLSAMLAWAQELHEAEFFELNAPIPAAESHEYHASSYIKLEPGFHSKPEAGNFVKLRIEEAPNLMEWYYEILNDDGSITYQHLMQAANDTTVEDEKVHVIVRINTLYDKDGHTEKTLEYIFERNNRIYWWNSTLGEFTVLYDYGAEEGDSWEIKVGNESIVMHVDEVEQYEYEGQSMRILRVSDAGDLFSGTIICGIGHLVSFFPERLMQKGRDYRVNGIRCFWRNGELVFKYGDRDCDEVYEEYHAGIEEDGPSTPSAGSLTVYPNPANGVLNVTVWLPQCDSPTGQTYRICNLMGQTVLTGNITDETQKLDVSALPEGMYFINIRDVTRKFVINR